MQAIHAETEGNPLFVGEVVRLLDAEGGLAEAGRASAHPAGRHVVIGHRLGRLSDRCRGARARLGARPGVRPRRARPHERAVRATALGCARRGAGRARGRRGPGTPGRLRFGHVLIRDTLYDELGSGRRLQLHQRAGAALEDLHAGDLEPHLAELAHHFFAAAGGRNQQAVGYARRAGDRAAAQLAFEEAVRLYGMALTLSGEDRARCELLLALGDAQGRSGDTPASRTRSGGRPLAERLGLAEQLARAALGYGGRLIWEVSRGDTDHVPLLERALAALGSVTASSRVRLLARLSGGPLRDTSYPPERRRSLSEEALAMARRLGARARWRTRFPATSPPTTRRTSRGSRWLWARSSSSCPSRPATGNAPPRVTSIGRPRSSSSVRCEGQRPTSRPWRPRRELRQPSQEWFVVVYGALVELLEGRLAEAGLIEAALRVGERAQSWNAAVSYGLQLYLLRREQGRVSEIEDLVRRSVEEYPRLPDLALRARAHGGASSVTCPRPAAVVAALAADDFASVPFDEEWLVSMSLIAETACALGEAELAEALYERLLPYADRVAISYAEVSWGAVARYLGLLATTSEAWDDAEQYFRQAVEVHERIGAESWLARTRRDHADLLVARARPGDSERARDLRNSAASTARALGMVLESAPTTGARAPSRRSRNSL